MTARRRIWPAFAIGAAVAGGLLALVLLTRDGGRPEVVDLESGEIAARVSLSSRILQFGDTLTARVDVTVDNRKIDPDSVRVRQEFSPWQLLGKPRRSRSDSGAATTVRTSYTLRCIIGPCVPPRETAPIEFNPPRLTYRRLDGERADPPELRWPVLVVHSNIVASDLERREAVSAPWKADMTTFPAASFAISPTLLRWLLIVAGVLLAAAGIALAYLAVPRKEPEVEPEPEPEPEPDVSPLERALMLLVEEARANGAADQRRALELVAEEMEAEEDGDLKIARRARALAWSEETPTVDETSALATQVRAWLDAHAPPVEELEESDAPAP